MKVFLYTGKGSRERNEDYIKSEMMINNISLHIAADGMGGYQYGDVASQVATETIFQYIKVNAFKTDIYKLIKDAIEAANKQITMQQNQYHTKLGTTIAGVLIKNNIAYAFWLGDVQIQHFKDNKQIFISESHSLINEMKKNGAVSFKDIERYKNVVTRSLSGIPLEETIPIVEIQLHVTDTICISTDGFYNSININCIESYSDTELNDFFKKQELSVEDNFSIIKICI